MNNQALTKFASLTLLLALMVTLLPFACDSDSKQPPKADFSAEPASGTVPLVVKFTDHSTGNIESWVWDFDFDGIMDSNEKNPSHIYNAPGTYTVAFKITGPDGTDSKIKTDYIQVSIPADFTASPTNGSAPLGVQFTVQSMDNVTEWEWDFDNDGTVDSTEKSPSYLYNAPGEYSVSLEVTGPDGTDTMTKTNLIKVIPATTPDFDSFKEMAQEAMCADISNRLFLIDQNLILWDWEGSCADYGFGTFLYKETVDNIVCSVTDSIGGPLYTYDNEAYKGMFQTILENKDGGDPWLGEGHTFLQFL